MKVNAAKSGTGRGWTRKFPGFRLDRNRRIGVALENVERFKGKVREMWRGNQSRTSDEQRVVGVPYARVWWGYFRLEKWIRWLRLLEASVHCDGSGCETGCRKQLPFAWGVASGRYRRRANDPVELSATRLQLPHAVGSCSDAMAAGFSSRIPKTGCAAVQGQK